MASWTRMLFVLDTEPAIKDSGLRAQDSGLTEGLGLRAEGLGLRAEGSGIEFRNLSFSFGDRQVLSDISFTIPEGRTVAVVGGTGSGKSTLVSLLPRLNNPPRGTVFLGGRDVLDIPLSELRGEIGFVPQEPFLFSDTLEENIAFGLRTPSASRRGAVLSASAIAQLEKDVHDFPNGYETLVGERGITLSGGQKQRTAIARALVIDPHVLILDDALSAVDTYTEEEILARLRGVMKSRTSIIISHRISTVRDADEIIVLHEGRMVEQGTHSELLRAGGHYADLYKKQLLEEELAAS
jgi:ATP-binding cassette subfamily B multidrug efflux pump